MPGVHSQEGTVCGPCCWHDLQPGPAQTPLPARPGRTPSLTPPLLGPGGPAFHRTGRSRGGLSLGGGHKAAILRLTQDLASDGCGQGGSRTFYLCVPPPTRFVFSCGFRESSQTAAFSSASQYIEPAPFAVSQIPCREWERADS